MSPCWRVPRWLGAGCGNGQGRAGAVVGTGLTPSLGINIPRLPAAVYSAGALGAAPTGSGGGGVGGGGDPATAQTFPSAQTGRQPCWPLVGGDKVVTPCFRFLGATSGALTWISQGLGDRWGKDMDQQTAGRGREKREGEGRRGGEGGRLQSQ